MSELRAIRIERGPQGFGGPLIIRPTEQKNKVMYITGGGTAPECLKKIVELSGMTPDRWLPRFLHQKKNLPWLCRLWWNTSLWYLSTKKNSYGKCNASW